MSGKSLINLSFINGKAMTFSVEDYMRIRTEHRVVGKLIGIPATLQRNLIVHALPAFYNDYETKLLLEEGIVVLDKKDSLQEPPDEKTSEIYENHSMTVEHEFQELYIESRLELTKAKMDLIIKGKREKLLKTGVPESEITLTAESVLKEETERLQKTISSKNSYVHIPTKHPFPTTENITKEFTVKNPRKYKVFKDLWSKGFHITTGDSFGCDFLTYPGDPMVFHASQVVHIVERDQPFATKYLISCSRISVTVNKKCLFAYVDEQGDVTYQTLAWDNPKLRELYPPPTTSSLADNEALDDIQPIQVDEDSSS